MIMTPTTGTKNHAFASKIGLCRRTWLHTAAPYMSRQQKHALKSWHGMLPLLLCTTAHLVADWLVLCCCQHLLYLSQAAVAEAQGGH
jgi:hypothetical protein